MRSMLLLLLQRRYAQPEGEDAFRDCLSAEALSSWAIARGKGPSERRARAYMTEERDVGGFDPDVMLPRRRALRAPVATGVHADKVIALAQPCVVPLRAEPGRVEQDWVQHQHGRLRAVE